MRIFAADEPMLLRNEWSLATTAQQRQLSKCRFAVGCYKNLEWLQAYGALQCMLQKTVPLAFTYSGLLQRMRQSRPVGLYLSIYLSESELTHLSIQYRSHLFQVV